MVERFFSRREAESFTNFSPQQPHLILLLSGPPSSYSFFFFTHVSISLSFGLCTYPVSSARVCVCACCSGKTSLLFQFAFNSAVALEHDGFSNGNVVFICNRRNLETNPPFLSRDLDPSSETFQRIQMKYVENDEDINKYFAAFHLHDTFPSTVVIDDFADFFDERRCKERYGNSPRGRELAMVRTLALCHNAIMHANETRPCKLVLSDTHRGDSPRLLFIYKRWVSTIFTITGDGCGLFTLTSDSNQENGSSVIGMKIAKYSIALQYLFLEGITQDSQLEI